MKEDRLSPQSTEPHVRDDPRQTETDEHRHEIEEALAVEISLRQGAERELAKSEERFRLMLAAAKEYAFIVVDEQGRIQRWNAGAEILFGYKEKEIVTQPFAVLFTPEDREAGAPQEELRVAAETGVARDDRWHMRRDGERFWTSGVTTALRGNGVRGFVKIVHDVTDQKRAETALRESEARYRQLNEELEIKTRKLEEAHQQKDHFLAVLSHELRNPLAPIRTAAKLVCEQEPEDPLLQQACTILERQVRVLIRLVDDLLDAARIASGKVQLRKELIEVKVLVERAVDMALPLIKGRKHQLSISYPGEAIWLDVDPVRIEQVLVNLLSNAAKYTPEGGKIWVNVEREGETALIRVRDNGIGIPPERIPELFTMFTQIERDLPQAEGGLGIGLALARSLLQLHGGTIECHSAGHGKGSEFIVSLPRAPKPPKSAVEPEEEAVFTETFRILVVDDNADAAEMMAALLRTRGHQVRTEYSGHAAITAAEHFHPQVIFLDLGMPDISGLEVAERLQQRPETRDAVLVALTGFGQEADIERTKRANFRYHLVKPADFHRVQEVLAELAEELK